VKLGKPLGRYRTVDLPRARDAAQKTELARFKGVHITAEREGDELVIYALHDEHGMPATTIARYSATDKQRRIKSLSDINRRNAVVHHRRV
jgi:hypothetical protein